MIRRAFQAGNGFSPIASKLYKLIQLEIFILEKVATKKKTAVLKTSKKIKYYHGMAHQY